jgi:CheY-like chemotaxis protein
MAIGSPAWNVGSGGSMKVLIVDDDAEVRATLAELLEAEGHSATQASSGQEAVELLRSTEMIDLLLTDLRMPGMDGWELVRAAAILRPRLKLGVMSGTPGFNAQHRLWVDVTLDKPVSREALRKALTSLAL